ncbi:hypothetical protein N824_20870 [Pedobacter sp. V48]|nr:hypothetical protein N824_20870 [Pedobacter sp. V48]
MTLTEKAPDLIRLDDKRAEDIREKIEQVASPDNDPIYGKSPDRLLNVWRGVI